MEEFRTLVLYRSKHGTTKKYAHWIADALDADVMEASKKDINHWSYLMTRYDMVIYGGNLNMGGINGIKEFKGTLMKYPIQNVAYFCVGSYPASEETTQEHLEANFTSREVEAGVKLFYCRGRLDYIGLGFLEKRIMGGLMKAIEKKYPEDRTEAEAEILEAYYDDVDWSGRYYIEPLVEYVKSFMTEEQIKALEPVAAKRVAERMKQEEIEEAEFEKEMDRREQLHQANLEKREEEKIKRMNKKQREKYFAMQEAKAQAAESEEDIQLLASDEGSVDDYSDFEDEEEQTEE